MKIRLNDEELKHLRAFLEQYEDSEQLSANEYVVDFYDRPEPVSIDLLIGKDGILIDGAAKLLYDATLDGWYVADPVSDASEVALILRQAGALQ